MTILTRTSRCSRNPYMSITGAIKNSWCAFPCPQHRSVSRCSPSYHCSPIALGGVNKPRGRKGRREGKMPQRTCVHTTKMCGNWVNWAGEAERAINTIFQKDTGYSKLKTSPKHFVKKACLNTRRRERVLGAPLNFRPVFLPRSMKLDPRQPPIPARPPLAMRYGGYHLPPRFLSSFLSTKDWSQHLLQKP